ncbi:unannotated protein [freshwater metagenome]|uniref:Unannotated protein n=1 Tax=freshwater metagenome TaxID=449393 RepID=A0A6J6YKU3_9ZZZZ
MREVRAPEHVLNSDFVTLTHFATLHIGEAGKAVAVDVLAWKHLDLARKCAGAELFGTLLSCPQAIPEPQQLRQPPATAFSCTELEIWVALKHARPQHEPHRTRWPPGDLGDIDAKKVAVLFARSRTRVSNNRHVVFLAQGPNRVIATIVIRRLVAPTRRDHDGSEAVLLRPLDFGKRVFNRTGDRNKRNATTTIRVCRAQVGKPTVMGLGTGKTKFGIEIAGKTETSTERNGSAAFDRVGIGIHNLGSDTVTIESLITLDGIPATSEFLVVFFEPLLGVLVVAHTESRRCFDQFLLLKKKEIKLIVILLLEVRAIVIRRQTSMAVCGDDQVWIVVSKIFRLHWSPLSQSVANS